MIRYLLPAVLCAAALSASADDLKLEPQWAGLSLKRPVQLTVPPDGTGRHFLVQQRGQVLLLPTDRTSTAKPGLFLDFSGRKMEENEFEEGLLNLSFHPKFADNGLFYVYYTQQAPKVSRVSELRVMKDDPNRADPASERVLLEIPQPFWNHNSGNMTFGPDGMLYIAVGDGGKRDGKYNLAQNPFVLNGKILRIDVNQRSGRRAYGIPADNPWADKANDGKAPEVWAWGMRNPWGLAFDAQGRLWCADVGQELWEEINLIERGGNYGWNFREGFEKFAHREEAPADDLKFVDPIHVYAHTDGISVTGGMVYRGKRAPSLAGQYLFADWGSGSFWALDLQDGKTEVQRILKGDGKVKPTAFCEDADGELIVLSWDGRLFRVAE